MLAVLGVVIISGLAVFLALQGKPSINVPAPPGWEPASEEMMKEFEKAAAQGNQDVSLDYLFSDGTLSNSIAVGHGKAYIMDSPSSEEFQAVEDFFEKHQSELIDQFKAAYQGYGINLKIEKFAVEEMSCGIPSLFMSMVISGQGLQVSQDYLFFFKDKMMYFSVITKNGASSNQEEADFLKKNISFQ